MGSSPSRERGAASEAREARAAAYDARRGHVLRTWTWTAELDHTRRLNAALTRENRALENLTTALRKRTRDLAEAHRFQLRDLAARDVSELSLCRQALEMERERRRPEGAVGVGAGASASASKRLGAASGSTRDSSRASDRRSPRRRSSGVLSSPPPP